MSTVNTLQQTIAKIIKDDTGANEAVYGIQTMGQQFYPIAQICIDDGDLIFNSVNNTFDVEAVLYIMVDGNDFEQVQTVLEELMVVFIETTSHTELTAVGVIDLKPKRMLPAINFENNTTLWRGAVHFDLDYTVEYDIASP